MVVSVTGYCPDLCVLQVPRRAFGCLDVWMVECDVWQGGVGKGDRDREVQSTVRTTGLVLYRLLPCCPGMRILDMENQRPCEERYRCAMKEQDDGAQTSSEHGINLDASSCASGASK